MTPCRDGVTVVIPTRNRLDLLRRSLVSAVLQKDVTVTAVVVDDGGDPATARALDELSGPRVQVVHLAESGGVARARNAGLALADTPWVAFLDDDDYWAPDKLRSQLDALVEAPDAGWSSVGAVHVDDVRALYWHRPPAAAQTVSMLARSGGIPGGGSGVLVAADLAREVGGFDPRFSLLADWDFYYRLALVKEVAPVDRPLVGYYRHRDSLFHDPVTLGLELMALEDKYRDTGYPVDLHYPHWAVQLLLMAWRRRDVHAGHRIVRSEVVRRAGKPAVVGSALARLLRTLSARRRECPAGWRSEPLGWLHCTP